MSRRRLISGDVTAVYLLSGREMERKLIELSTDGEEEKGGKITRAIGGTKKLMVLAMRVAPHR